MVFLLLFLLLFGLGMGNLLCVGMSGKMGKQRIYARPFFANIRFRCNCSALVYAAVSDKGGFRFFAGMFSATVLEYLTGAAMERIFHVRYWDYSDKPLNVNGHICASSSLAWGVFSVLLTMYGHSVIERGVLRMNTNLLEFIVLALTVYISVDMSASVREALNLKEILLSLEQNSAEFRHIQKHFEVLSAFYGSSIKEKSEAGLRKINSAIGTGKEMYGRIGASSRERFQEKLENKRKRKEYTGIRSLLRRNPCATSKMHKQAFDNFQEFIRNCK